MVVKRIGQCDIHLIPGQAGNALDFYRRKLQANDPDSNLILRLPTHGQIEIPVKIAKLLAHGARPSANGRRKQKCLIGGQFHLHEGIRAVEHGYAPLKRGLEAVFGLHVDIVNDAVIHFALSREHKIVVIQRIGMRDADEMVTAEFGFICIQIHPLRRGQDEFSKFKIQVLGHALVYDDLSPPVLMIPIPFGQTLGHRHDFGCSAKHKPRIRRNAKCLERVPPRLLLREDFTHNTRPIFCGNHDLFHFKGHEFQGEIVYIGCVFGYLDPL